MHEVHLFSSGSNVMLISQSLANKLQLSGITKEIASTSILSTTNKVPSNLVNPPFHREAIKKCYRSQSHGLFTNIIFQHPQNESHLQKESFNYISDTTFDP